MIKNLIFLLFGIIAVAVLGLFCYLLIAIAEYFEKADEERRRRNKIRTEFKKELGEIRNDDGVYAEVYDERREAV